jgi:preprotein translocase subunit SecA
LRKNNSIELTDNGIDYLTVKDEDSLFVMPDLGVDLADIEKEEIRRKYARKKDALIRDYSTKAQRIHAVKLLKAYTVSRKKDVDYVVMDSKVKNVDEQTGRIMDGRR